MKSSRLLLLSGIFVSLGMLVSCVDDDLANGGGKNAGDKGTAVTFNVSYAQDDAQNAMVAPAAGNTRAFAGAVTRVGFANGLAMLGLTPEDLTSQKLPVSGADNTCLIETTTAGVYPSPVQVAGAPQTRADITTIEKMPNFYTTGFCGTSKVNPTIPWLYNGDTTTPWFYNKETNPSGTLVTPIKWSWDKPYGIFFAVAVGAKKKSNVKLTFSPKRAAIPYVDFTVKPNVVDQEDLMTACSGEIHYEKRFVAPTVNLKFRHALTAVRFKVGQNLSYDKTITKVEIINAMSKGCYNLPRTVNDRGAWGPLSGKTTFTLDNVSVSTSKEINDIIVGKNDNYTFYMIPQKLEGVSVKITFSDGSSIKANLSGEWRAGTTKTYALCENKSTWNYQITVVPPSEVSGTATTASYTVESYRMVPGSYIKHPVPWKVVGYQEFIDGNATGPETTEKPAWLTSLSMESGNGSGSGLSPESGTATIKPAIIDKLAEYNKVLQDAKEKGLENDPYDLSTHDLNGKETSRNTANCYLISAPGWYKIPLVYGNGIVDGHWNSDAYKTNNTGKHILAHFTDHDNSTIKTPYINCQSPTNFAKQAKVMWTDQPGIVDNLSVVTKIGEDGKSPDENAYLKFYVPRENIKNGNAVIAVKNAKGRFMWSWHLWFAQKDALNTVECNNNQNKVYKFAKQPLGFAYRKWEESTFNKQRIVLVKVEQTFGNKDDKQYAIFYITQKPSTSVKQFSSTLYQFGRKDAFTNINNIAEGGYYINDYIDMTTKECIENPNCFILDGKGRTESYHNLWSMNNLGGTYDETVVKTIFDPCPVGFHVPTKGALECFTKHESDSGLMKASTWDNGWNFRKNGNPHVTMYLPAVGYLSPKNGNMDYSSTCYWSSNPNSAICFAMLFNSGTVSSLTTNIRHYGLSILPVSE